MYSGSGQSLLLCCLSLARKSEPAGAADPIRPTPPTQARRAGRPLLTPACSVARGQGVQTRPTSSARRVHFIRSKGVWFAPTAHHHHRPKTTTIWASVRFVSTHPIKKPRRRVFLAAAAMCCMGRRGGQRLAWVEIESVVRLCVRVLGGSKSSRALEHAFDARSRGGEGVLLQFQPPDLTPATSNTSHTAASQARRPLRQWRRRRLRQPWPSRGRRPSPRAAAAAAAG